jgi:hypothetical protein
VAEEGADARAVDDEVGGERRIGAGGEELTGDEHRDKPLAGIEQQRRGGHPAIAGAQHIGGTDIARSDRADVDANRAGQQQAERNGAKEVPQHGRDQEIHVAAPSRVAAWLKTGRPATKLCMTAPCMRAPSKTVLRERERKLLSVTTQG